LTAVVNFALILILVGGDGGLETSVSSSVVAARDSGREMAISRL
jgi:hypothetical protein